jgi:hypothetical protein
VLLLELGQGPALFAQKLCVPRGKNILAHSWLKPIVLKVPGNVTFCRPVLDDFKNIFFAC